MRKCDFCKNELTCSGVNRSECIVRDFYNFEAERTPADDVTTITRLIMGCQTLYGILSYSSLYAAIHEPKKRLLVSYRHLTAGKRVWKAKHWETNRC